MPSPLLRLRRLVRAGPSDAPGDVIDLLGRIGLVGYGVVHMVVAWLAVLLAFGMPDASADAEGAVGTIARTPGGRLALGVAAVGLVAFAAWQLTAAWLGFRWVSGGERFRKRVGAVSKSIAVLALTAVVVGYLFGIGSPGNLAADLLALPAGRVLLGLAAAVILIIAGAMTYTGLRRTFMGDLDVRHLGDGARRAIELAGSVGHLSRALALAVIGVLAATAAVRSDPDRAGGLDPALRLLAATTWGAALLVVVAGGFAAFGLFCLADAATRRA